MEKTRETGLCSSFRVPGGYKVDRNIKYGSMLERILNHPKCLSEIEEGRPEVIKEFLTRNYLEWN